MGFYSNNNTFKGPKLYENPKEIKSTLRLRTIKKKKWNLTKFLM